MSIFSKIKRARNLILSRNHEVAFYSSHFIDETWIRTTAKECNTCGIDVAIFSGNSLPEKIKNFYKSIGIKFYDNANANEVTANIIVTATSGIDKDYFKRRPKALIHMPHSICSLHMIYPEGTFDGYDYLFAVGPHHDTEMKEIAKRRSLENFVQTMPCGYGKMDLLIEESHHHNKHKNGTILLAPSWGHLNILESIGYDLCRRILESGYKLIVRPHPMFFIEKKDFMKSFLETFASYDGFTIETSMDLGHGVFTAEILITDYSGIAQEFSALSKNPVIFVDVPTKVLNPRWKDLEITPIELASRGIIGPLAAPNSKDVLLKIEDSLKNKGFWQSNAKQFYKQYLHEGKCSSNSAQFIQTILQQGGI